ncbi:MAG: DUF262 domain-containing protein [Ignavibacteriota bacterium]
MKITKEKKPLDKLYTRRNRYDLQPDFQRGKVWSPEKSRKLLDTIYKRWDIPKVYLNVVDEENFEVIDGQQRLTAILKFYDDDLALPNETENIGGLTYQQLEDRIKDRFDDYEIDLVLISEATEEEIRDLFLRLQLGTPTNTAERLNAISGSMTSFVKKLAGHNFFKNKVVLKNNRLAHFAVVAQLTQLSLDGIRNVKFKDLSEFFKFNKNFNDASKEGKLIRSLINEADKIFIEKNKVFRNRALIVSFFVLLKSLMDKGFKPSQNSRILLKNFYDHFYARLQTEIDKGASATDAELIIFQSKVNQDADSRESIQIRNNIVSRNLILYDETFRKYLDTSEIDSEYNQLKIARDTKILADGCLEQFASINRAYSTNKGEDLFKITNELFISLPRIGNTINSKEDYKNFIDSTYKIFYEGSGSLKRIPDSFKKDNSIFFDIKHLRTDIYHDIEHGKNSDVQKKKKIISNIYYKYTSKKTLNSLKVTEYRMIQSKMLIKINSELVSILESL